jgi:hypothetical protein
VTIGRLWPRPNVSANIRIAVDDSRQSNARQQRHYEVDQSDTEQDACEPLSCDADHGFDLITFRFFKDAGSDA